MARGSPLHARCSAETIQPPAIGSQKYLGFWLDAALTGEKHAGIMVAKARAKTQTVAAIGKRVGEQRALQYVSRVGKTPAI